MCFIKKEIPKITYCIPSKNNLRYLKTCIPSIRTNSFRSEYALYDERLGQSHRAVPGPDGDFGYGGHCFPKDIAALKNVMDNLGIDTTMLTATINKNNSVRTDRD